MLHSAPCDNNYITNLPTSLEKEIVVNLRTEFNKNNKYSLVLIECRELDISSLTRKKCLHSDLLTAVQCFSYCTVSIVLFDVKKQ